MSAQTFGIQILGRTFKVGCPLHEQEALYQAVDTLNQRLQELKQRIKVNNTEQLIVIVALNLCNELFQVRQKSFSHSADLEQRMLVLQDTLEQALIQFNSN